MKTKKPNAAQIWKQCEDLLAPRLRLSITDRVVYSHLLRHSRLEGKPRLRFSIPWLSRGICLCSNSTRWAVRRLISRGLLRLVQCSKAGHVVEVLLPDEILAAGGDEADRTGGPVSPTFLPAIYSEGEDFLKTAALRRSIHARERGRCFYCLRQLTPQARCLDHVLPLSEFGSNSYRNLVSCCLQCNSRKGERSALDFLRRLYRERRLSDAELADRLRTLDALASGKLRPAIAPIANPRRMGRSPLNPANP
jgi:HNH endonuclease